MTIIHHNADHFMVICTALELNDMGLAVAALALTYNEAPIDHTPGTHAYATRCLILADTIDRALKKTDRNN